MADKIFVNGLISKDIPDTAPDYILGKHSIKVQDLINWLEANKHLADANGWINTITKRSQSTGKRFIEVDTWQPKKQEPVVQLSEESQQFMAQHNDIVARQKAEGEEMLKNISF